MSSPRIIIIGAGAAGIFAAVNVARLMPKASVTVLEKTPKLLSKVKISGGGRCNVTHACFDNAALSKYYARGEKQLRGAFSRFNAADTIGWFEERGVKLKTEPDGRMFPVTDDSQTIIDCLLNEAAKYKVNIITKADVTGIERQKQGFTIIVNDQQKLVADKLVVAFGGHHKSSAYDWLQAFGHSVVPPVSSLFTFNLPGADITKLMGVAVPEVQVRIAGTKLEQKGPLLITHWGFSGPVVLRTSSWGARLLHNINYRYEVLVNWIPEYNEETLRTKMEQVRKELAPAMVVTRSPFGLPKRLWEHLCAKAEITDKIRWADVPKKSMNKLITNLVRDSYKAEGKTTFKEEFVTAGGIELSEVDFRTMESMICPGLYFAGEVLDIDGITGGFNFQSAWTTGWIAAQAMAVL
jgi:predicted Rossmann fold flavoprotein